MNRSLLDHGSLVVAGAFACHQALLTLRGGGSALAAGALALGGATMLLGGGYRYRTVDDAAFDAYGREGGVRVMVLAAALWVVGLAVTALD